MINIPRKDRTGLIGMGPCFGSYGCQRGYRRQFNETGIPGYLRYCSSQNESVDEKNYLAIQEKRLENQLQFIKERLSNLDETDKSL